MKTLPVIAGIFALGAAAVVLLQINKAALEEEKRAVASRIEVLRGEIENTKEERAALEEEIIQATDLEAWVLASMPLQRLVVEINNSMGPQSEIVDLTIERDAETPSQLRMHLTLNTASDTQLYDTLAVIQREHYREFNPTQARVQGNLVYSASLLWHPESGMRQTPDERTAGGEEVP